MMACHFFEVYCVVSRSCSLLVSKHSVVVEEINPVLDVRQKNVKPFAQSRAVNLWQSEEDSYGVPDLWSTFGVHGVISDRFCCASPGKLYVPTPHQLAHLVYFLL